MALLSRKTRRRTGRVARRAVDRAVLSFVNGLVYVTGGAARRQVGNVAKDLVFERGKLSLWRVRPIEDEEYELGHADFKVELVKRQPVPLLLIPPLMVRPFVYDLRPEHSMVRALRNAGFDVFIVDFGVPDEADERLRLDDYVMDFVPTCVDEALRASSARELSLVGYCMGGIFALLHVATFEDARVKNIVTIGAPINFEKMGLVSVAARLGVPVIDRLLDRIGNVPAHLSRTGFNLMGGTRTVTKYADLFANLYDEEYVRGFDSIDTWLRQMIPYPRDAFRQTLKDVVRGNKMLKNTLVFGEKRANMQAVTCPILAFAGKTDNIATVASTKAILDLVGSADKTFSEVPGGHIGVVAGSSAPDAVWQPAIAWLRARCGGRDDVTRVT
jgi:polyhydroxyalkanoate synthase